MARKKINRNNNKLVVIDNEVSISIYFVRGIAENEEIIVVNNMLTCQEHDVSRLVIYANNIHKGIYNNNKLTHNKFVANYK